MSDGKSQMATPMLEVCVDSVPGLQAAIEGGADRIELCSALALGGLTPSAGFMAHAAQSSPIAVHALIRPRAGDFVFDAMEVEAMIADIDCARACGLAGVVIGASLPDGRLDGAVLSELVAAADGLDMTLHRAFDLVPDFNQALELAISLGFRRVLTSGGAGTAHAGFETLRSLAQRFSAYISIMPGGGVNADNAQALLALDGIAALHASCSRSLDAGNANLLALGFINAQCRITDVEKVRALKAVVVSATAR